MIFLIAFLPALAVYCVSYFTNSKAYTIIAAITAALLGVFTGNPIFLGVDILFVALATVLAYHHIDVRTKQIKEESDRQARIAEMESTASWNLRHAELLVERKKQKIIREAKLKELRLNAAAAKRSELRAEQARHARAANDQSLRESARARAAEKVAEIESLIKAKYSEGDA